MSDALSTDGLIPEAVIAMLRENRGYRAAAIRSGMPIIYFDGHRPFADFVASVKELSPDHPVRKWYEDTTPVAFDTVRYAGTTLVTPNSPHP